MSEDRDKAKPEPETQQREDEDVEAHRFEAKDKFAATEEGPDVEAHTVRPNIKPKAKP